MEIIDTPEAMANALATHRNPWLLRRLVLYQSTLQEAECEIGELGPVIIVDPGDTAKAIEQAAGVDLSGEPTWESCMIDHDWCELVFVTSDDGGGVVTLIPNRDDIDPTLRAIIRNHALDVSA
jgi:hypothetical protein